MGVWEDGFFEMIEPPLFLFFEVQEQGFAFLVGGVGEQEEDVEGSSWGG